MLSKKKQSTIATAIVKEACRLFDKEEEVTALDLFKIITIVIITLLDFFDTLKEDKKLFLKELSKFGSLAVDGVKNLNDYVEENRTKHGG